MGFDFEEFFRNAGEAAQEQIDNLIKTGAPALEASLEQWGIDTLKKWQDEAQGRLNTAVNDITKNDPAPGSFGAAVNATIQNTVFQKYGLLIVVGIGGLVVVGIMLGRK